MGLLSANTLGRHHLIHQAENVFYPEARFYCATEVEKLLRDSGFVDQAWEQTVSKPLNEIEEIKPFRAGHGQGAFVVVGSTRS
jgi:hypothetical protein